MNKFYVRVIKTLKVMVSPVVIIHLEGEHHLPEGGYVLAVNHISQLDPVLMGVALADDREVHALAKASLFSVPVIGKVLTRMGHIPVSRGTRDASQSLAVAVRSLEAGKVVGIYPEGTIPQDYEVGVFKTGAARLALEAGVPVIPVGQYGAQHLLPIKFSWSKLLKAFFGRRVHHHIHIGEPLQPDLASGDAEKVTAFTTVIRDNIVVLRAGAKAQYLKTTGLPEDL